MRPPKNAIILNDSDMAQDIGEWGLWKDVSGKTDWSHTYIHIETKAAFGVIYSVEHGAYAIYLGVENGHDHPSPEVIRKLGVAFLLEASPKAGSWEA